MVTAPQSEPDLTDINAANTWFDKKTAEKRSKPKDLNEQASSSVINSLPKKKHYNQSFTIKKKNAFCPHKSP